MEAVGRLAGGVAHDFNNLLTVIASCTDFVLSDPTLGDEHRDDLKEVKKATDRATALTRQMVAFGRTQVLRPATINMNDRLTELLPMLKRLFESTIDIRIQPAKDLWSVRADPGQIEQVLLNLAINSRDAMPDGGTLTFTTENRTVDANPSGVGMYRMDAGDYVLLRVRDTGVGMDEETQRKIFEPFFTTKEVGKGTGLGLATVHGIVTRSGGSVNAYSEVGRGTSFKVYLPQSDLSQVVSVPLPTVRAPTGTETILVVEDADGLRELAKRLLERQGYTVLVAANAAEALQLFEQNASIDLLLTDVVMPGASGPELTQQLVDRRPALKVVYMSGYTEDAIVHHGVLKPGISFLHKPFTSEALGRKLRGVLDGQVPGKAEA
jgi:CheY-like chemotaxis protein